MRPFVAMMAFVFLLGFSQSQETMETRKLKQEIDKLQQRVKALEEQGQGKDGDETRKVKSEQSYFTVKFKEGLHIVRLETEDKAFSAQIGGRTYIDFGFVSEDQAIVDNLGKREDYAKFRSVRITLQGTLYKRFIYKTDIEFVNQVTLKDVYAGFNGLPLSGTIKVGHFKEPFSLEELTSRHYLTFMERATVNALTPERNLGIAYYGHQGKRMTFALGVFREVADRSIEDDSGSYAFTCRFSGLPFYLNKGNILFHIGGSYRYSNPRNDSVRYRAFPENNVNPRFVNTGVITGVEDVHQLGVEGALVWGAFSLQSEFICSWVRPKANNSLFASRQYFWGYYVYASFFFTGQRRRYKTSSGVFSGIIPNSSVFSDKDSIGAIELAVRYSKLDLNDDIRGRRMDNITIGLNWYLNPNLRLMLNYIYSLVSNLPSSNRTDTHILAAQLQIDF